MRPKFGNRPSAVAPVMKSSEAGIERDDRDARGRSTGGISTATSIGRASRSGATAWSAEGERRRDRRAGNEHEQDVPTPPGVRGTRASQPRRARGRAPR